MQHFFRHPEHTGGETICIGENEVEALQTLEEEYGFELEEVLDLCLYEYVWEYSTEKLFA